MPEPLLKKWFRKIPGAQTVDVFGMLKPAGLQAEVGSVGVNKNAEVRHIGAKNINTKTKDIAAPQQLKRHLNQLPAPPSGRTGFLGLWGNPAIGNTAGSHGGASAPALPSLDTSLDASAPHLSNSDQSSLKKKVASGSIKAGEVFSV
eukprot:Hpha_TRINITY_DN35301_c0_g1::TRINITY_DN35301_c0_g1_i1::g.85036::m.85036